MKRITSFVLGVWAFVYALAAEAGLQLPNYASGGSNLTGDLEATGSVITKVLTGVTVMVGIGGIIFSGLAFAAGDGEKGKERLKNSVIGLVIAAVATGIAAVATGNR